MVAHYAIVLPEVFVRLKWAKFIFGQGPPFSTTLDASGAYEGASGFLNIDDGSTSLLIRFMQKLITSVVKSLRLILYLLS